MKRTMSLTKQQKKIITCFGIIVLIVLLIVVITVVPKALEKQKVRKEITNYLSCEYGLENVEVVFTNNNYSGVYKYGVEVSTSNLNMLTYEEMTRMESYLTSHTKLDYCDVTVNRYICGDDSYIIFPSSVYKNGVCVYELQSNV